MLCCVYGGTQIIFVWRIIVWTRCVCVCASLLEGAILLFGLTLLLHPFLWSPLPHCPLRTSRDAVAHNLNHFLLIPFPISYILAILLIIIFFVGFIFLVQHTRILALHTTYSGHCPVLETQRFFFGGGSCEKETEIVCVRVCVSM